MAERIDQPAMTNGSSHASNGEKYSNAQHYDDHAATLSRIKTAGSVSISADLFERLYLSPQNKVSGDLRKTFGNPTPVAIAGFLLSLTPLSMVLMGWRGAGGLGASGIGSYLWFGGLLMLAGGLGEWILGNTFPTVVFMTFGAFWLTFGYTLIPDTGAYGAYSPDPTKPWEGLASAQFAASFAFFNVAMGILCLVFLIASVRTNIVFFLIFLLLIPSFGLFAGAFWNNAQGNTAVGLNCQIAAGALLLVISLLGWYLFMALILLSVDFPLDIPLGDLSTMVKGKSDLAKSHMDRRADEGEL